MASQETKGQGLGEDGELVWEGEGGRDVGQNFNEAGQWREGEVRDKDNNVSRGPGHRKGHSGDVTDEEEGFIMQCSVHVLDQLHCGGDWPHRAPEGIQVDLGIRDRFGLNFTHKKGFVKEPGEIGMSFTHGGWEERRMAMYG